MRIGALRSTAFFTYIRQKSQLFEKARTALAGSGAMTLSDVIRLDTATTNRVGGATTGAQNERTRLNRAPLRQKLS